MGGEDPSHYLTGALDERPQSSVTGCHPSSSV